MNKQIHYKIIALAAATLCSGGAQAMTFEGETVSGNFDSTVSFGVGVRAGKQACGLVIGSSAGNAAGASGPSAPGGCADALSSLNDQGDLNYNRGDRFTTYLKGTHELLLNMPEDVKFLGRVSWLRDYSATRNTGNISGGNPTGRSLSDDATNELHSKVRLLDLWVSKSFDLGEERARIRVGNQVVNWGESLFIAGGINQTNAIDIMRLSNPGTQLKEAILPAPMVNFATGLGRGFSVETYVQQGWESNYFPPVGSYWSTATVGIGAEALGVPTTSRPRSTGQYGVALRYTPPGADVNFGLYVMNYHDKSPVLSTANTPSGLGYSYLEDRKMVGLSANFPLGNWAIGTELSYRPKDPVSLNGSVPNANGGFCMVNGKCYVEAEKYQLAVTGLLSLSPSEHGSVLKALGADTATLMVEAVAIKYPNLKSSYGGIPVAAGLWGWGYDTTANANSTLANGGNTAGVGSSTSYGYNFDFSWVYDGSVIPGWQVIPEIYFFHAVKGRTPNATATFMEGAKMANFTVTFMQNPAKWQVALNFAKFWGGASVFDQPLRDRSFYGMTVSRNF
ncbi:DUF1302 domain-containing protein [Herbaspirillum seropedicae]|uniref:DUF1302 domain-containing protein n=1 Tax=Herbaspirillum seropedicae TaxID=964 RepID=UPI00285F7748|nr:DUF1302 domain-containing protein [Herbaspirillum seropedicae]MDR6395249.1 hypothetical protein [Herbaspirillum seropedicae]